MIIYNLNFRLIYVQNCDCVCVHYCIVWSSKASSLAEKPCDNIQSKFQANLRTEQNKTVTVYVYTTALCGNLKPRVLLRNCVIIYSLNFRLIYVQNCDCVCVHYCIV